MAIKILLDSTADIAPELEPNFLRIALPIFFGDEKFRDGVDLSHAEFYKKLAEASELPKTSQVTPFEFEEVFSEAVADGSDLVAILISGKLSGTYQSAVSAAERFKGKVFLVDSGSATIGTGILAEYALRLRESGLSARDIAQKLEQAKSAVSIVAMVDTLEYLRKGGRISRTVAFAGELLNFKPVISLEAGEIKLLGKARGARQGNNLLEQEIEKAGGVRFDMPVLLGYSGTDPTTLNRYINDFSHLWKDRSDSLRIAEIGSVVGTHVGPGAVGVAFFAAEV